MLAIMPVLVLLVIFGSLMVLGLRYMKHVERLAEFEVRRLEAATKADQPALPPERDELAAELLDAYDEAGQGLHGER